MTELDSTTPYASFTARASAFVTDAVVVAAALVALLLAGTLLERMPGSGRVEAVLLWGLLLLYEPLLVWRRGATIGHSRLNLFVANRDGSRPGFARALARFVVKAPLGLFSFVPMLLTRQHLAMQDIVTGTRVLVRDPEDAAPYHVSRERPADWMAGVPSRMRRVIVILVYLLALIFAESALLQILTPLVCGSGLRCTSEGIVVMQAMGWLVIISIIATITLGWRGHLPGARRAATSVAAGDS